MYRIHTITEPNSNRRRRCHHYLCQGARGGGHRNVTVILEELEEISLYHCHIGVEPQIRERHNYPCRLGLGTMGDALTPLPLSRI